MSIGSAPEGDLAAVALLRYIGGQMQGRLFSSIQKKRLPALPEWPFLTMKKFMIWKRGSKAMCFLLQPM